MIKQILLTLLPVFTMCFSIITCMDHSLLVYESLDAGQTAAQLKHAKMIVIFDLWGSSTPYVDQMLKDGEVRKALRDCVVARLRCDDRRVWSDSVTIGEYYSRFQIGLTGKLYQPMFCILDESGKLLSPPQPYCKKEALLQYLSRYAH